MHVYLPQAFILKLIISLQPEVAELLQFKLN